MPIRDGGVTQGGGELEVASKNAIVGGPVDPDAAAETNRLLTLDEAEIIAARRLRELAIRLGDGVDDGFDNASAPFDADRMFRDRLAVRISSLATSASESAAETGDDAADFATGDEPQSAESPYAITEAQPLTAYGAGVLALYGPQGRLLLPPPPAVEAPQDRSAEVSVEEDLLANHGEASAGHIGEGAAAAEQQPETSDRPADTTMRLVDLINEQQTLLNRLAYLSTEAGFGGDAARGLEALLQAGTLSDAEQLFETGTYKAEPIKAGMEDAEDAPLPISAEQLIAALEGAAQAKPIFEEPRSGSLPQDKDAPGVAAARETPVQRPRKDRAPMIIERARAEMTAIANGEIVQQQAQPRGFFGFFAGLSLSLALGAALYHLL